MKDELREELIARFLQITRQETEVAQKMIDLTDRKRELRNQGDEVFAKLTDDERQEVRRRRQSNA